MLLGKGGGVKFLRRRQSVGIVHRWLSSQHQGLLAAGGWAALARIADTDGAAPACLPTHSSVRPNGCRAGSEKVILGERYLSKDSAAILAADGGRAAPCRVGVGVVSSGRWLAMLARVAETERDGLE